MKSIKAYTLYNPSAPKVLAVDLGVAIILLFLLSGIFCGAKPAAKQLHPQLQYLSGQTVFYAGDTYKLSWQKGPGATDQYDVLLFALYHGERTVVKQQLKSRFPLEVTLCYPEVRPGVIIEANLVISAPNREKSWQVIYSQTLYFVSQSLKNGLKEKLPSLSVGVLDRSPGASLKRFLQDTGLSFSEITTVEDFKGQWLLCSGLNFAETPGLFSELLTAVRRGVSVMVFPPMQGWFNLPPYEKGLLQVMGDEILLRDLDRRWNFVTVRPGPQRAAVYFQYHPVNNETGIKCVSQGPGFTWLEFRYPRAGLFLWGWDPVAIAPLNPAVLLFLSQLLRDVDFCLRRPKTFLKKGFWTSKNFSYFSLCPFVYLGG